MPQGFHGLQKYYKFRVACYIVMLVSESYPQPISGQLEKPGFCCRFLLLTNLRFWTKGNAGIWGKILLRPDTVIWKLQAVPSKISLACGELCQNQAIGFYKLPGGGSGSIFGGQAGVHDKRVTDHGNAAICQKA